MIIHSGSKCPDSKSYDVVIVGGAIMGSSTAWFLTENPDFCGSVLVVERDPAYAQCSTSHTNSCIRQQFSNELNIRISQFTARFANNLREVMGGDERVPELSINNFGYLYLADTENQAEALRRNQKVQLACGAGTRLLDREAIRREFPFYNLDDIVLGSINTVDEGYWDGNTVFDWLRKSARERGVEFISNEVIAMRKNAAEDQIASVTLASGETVHCGYVVNASGPRAAATSRMAGIEIPVEPRKRHTYIFTAEKPLDQVLPLTIDPSGVHFRQDGKSSYLAGGHAAHDPAVEYDDFEFDHSLWQEHIWPHIANRIPQFEAIRVTNEWVGHYAYNVFDQNAIVGPHENVRNFLFQNGFSGHGLQQAPAMGRAISEWITYGEYRMLDMTPFSFERIASGRKFGEAAII